MKPIKFKDHNVTFAKDQEEYKQLPAFRDQDGTVVTCYKLSWIEKIKVLFTGKIWFSTMTFNQPLQPQYMTVKRKEVFLYTEELELRALRNSIKKKIVEG